MLELHLQNRYEDKPLHPENEDIQLLSEFTFIS